MSVDFGKAVVAGLLHNGVKVSYPLGDGWLRAGNGQTSAYAGMIFHHTATGSSNTAPAVLWNGRPDLPGPLCNTAGLADGTIAMIAAHPANHAGASGGKSMGPLPTTRTFNKLVWGHEVVYPGTVPMSPAQYRSMLILGGVISGILRRGSAEWCRGHRETSITGKWDPGYATGKTIDLGAARRDTWAALHSPPPQEDDMPSPADLWNHRIPDRFFPLDSGRTLSAGETVGWAAAHAAKAGQEARDAKAAVSLLAARVDALRPAALSGPAAMSDADIDRIAARVVDLLSRRTAA